MKCFKNDFSTAEFKRRFPYADSIIITASVILTRSDIYERYLYGECNDMRTIYTIYEKN